MEIHNGSANRFWDALHGKQVDRAPVVPKIWLDWTATQGYFESAEAISDPEIAMLGVVRAAKETGFDAARAFLMPRRKVVLQNGILTHISPEGRALGSVDLSGGWATHFADSTDFDLSDPNIMMNPQSYAARQAPLRDEEDIDRIVVPKAEWYEEQGYGRMLEKARVLANDSLELIGDCNTGTLSFYVAIRGMMDAMMDMIMNPELVHAAMEKGISISLERARFFIQHGIRVLRYNDSAANMKLISPEMWETFIAPHIKHFCTEVHRMAPQAKIYCHICGNVKPILENLVDTGLDCIAPLDPLGGCDVSYFRERVGADYPLMGGINTLSLLQEEPENVYAEATSCIRQGGRGYIVGSGCAVARDTPRENLLSLITASIQEADNVKSSHLIR